MKYHFIGIKGSGMAGLAQIMHDLGNEVQGSDVTHHLFTEDALREKNIKILPFDENNINDQMIVVIGNAFDENNVEVKKTLELGVKHYTYYELLHELVNEYNTVSICGCHGKTTTTGLLAHIFNNLVGANYLIGDGTGYAKENNKYFFLESCEYKRHFLSYYPKYIILTNIELDHIDYYKDIEDMKNAYEEFLRQCDKDVIACGDDENVRSLKTDKKLIYYGFNDNNEWTARDIKTSEDGTTFNVYHNNEFVIEIFVPLFGKHMVLNTLAVVVFSHLMGLNLDEVKEEIKTFKNLKRRFATKEIGNVITIDDYAHHPTEVKVTLEAARERYKDKELVAVFLDNTYSRTSTMYKDFANALNVADKAYVTDIFSDRETIDEYPNTTPMLIVNAANNTEWLHIGSKENLINEDYTDCIKPLLKHKNAVIVFMGCKEVYYVKNKLEKVLRGM